MEIFWYSLYTAIIGFIIPSLFVCLELIFIYVLRCSPIILKTSTNRLLVDEILIALTNNTPTISQKSTIDKHKTRPSQGWHISWHNFIVFFIEEMEQWGRGGSRENAVNVYLYGRQKNIDIYLKQIKGETEKTDKIDEDDEHETNNRLKICAPIANRRSRAKPGRFLPRGATRGHNPSSPLTQSLTSQIP